MTGLQRVALLMATAFGLSACIEPTVRIRRDGSSGTRPSAPSAATSSSVATHIVKAGDTLFRIAFTHQVTVDDLVRWNGIRDPNLIYIGQSVRIQDPELRPTTTDSALAVAPATTPESATPGTTQPGTVEPNGVVSQALAEPEIVPGQLEVTTVEPAGVSEAPSIEAPTANQSTSTPVSDSGASGAAGTTVAGTSPSGIAAASSSTEVLPEEATMPAPSEAQTVSSTAASATASSSVASAAPAAVRGMWAWPLSGKLVETYVAGDQTRSGLKIAASEGAPIFAAADGEVIFSGTGITGYGELIVVQHAGGMLSAYGHNRARRVQEGAKVKRGQIIGEVGRDLIGRNLLHFEIRQNGKPVDPLRHLPERRG